MGFDLVSLVLALLILGFLIAIHEAGHMLVAKRVGMRVLRFSIGLGPVLWKRTWGETTFQVAAVPFGGFVEIDGMNPLEEHEDPDDPRLYENKSVWARTAVILAGPLTNYLFAFLFAGIVFGAAGIATKASTADLPVDLGIESVTKGAAADKAGILSGDVVTHVDGYPMKNLNSYYDVLAVQKQGYRYAADPKQRQALRDFQVKVRRGTADLVVTHKLLDKRKMVDDLDLKALPSGAGVQVVKVAPGASTELRAGDVILAVGDRPIRQENDLLKPATLAKLGFRFAGKDRWILSLWIKRKDAHFKRDVKPDEQTGLIGVRFQDPLVWRSKGFAEDLKAGLYFPVEKSQQMLQGLGKLVKFDKKTAASAQGPVGIVREVQTQLKAGLSEAVLITIILSVLLGLFNLLPIPALDGGRILFRVVEIITRIRLKPLREAQIHSYGFWVLLALLVVVTIKDVRGCIGI